MYAICRIAGQQYRVEPDTRLKVNLLNVPEGDTVEFEELLMVSDGKKTELGTPKVAGKVVATVVKHGRYPTIRVFKRKRRKDYRVTRGHRQDYTEILINRIEK